MSDSVPPSAQPWEETPLAQALEYAPIVWSLVWKSVLTITNSLLYTFSFLGALRLPFIVPISILLYILAPGIVLVQIIFDFLLFTPYHTFLYLADAAYPLYVFCGIACITGVLVGGLGRALAWRITQIILEVTERNEKDEKLSAVEEKNELNRLEDWDSDRDTF